MKVIKSNMGTKLVLAVSNVTKLRKANPPWSVIKIAKKYGLTRQAVYQFMKRHGIS